MELTLGFALIFLGFLLLAAEVFIPSGGILGILSLAALALGVVFTFWASPRVGLVTMIGVFVAAPVLVAVLMPYWSRSPIGKRLVMNAPDPDAGGAAPAAAALESLRGRIGKTLSSLRPAGVVDFDGQRTDALTEGMMVDPGHWVKCVDVRAGKVIVRPVAAPSVPPGLENADFS